MLKFTYRFLADYIAYGLPTFFHTQFFKAESPSFIPENKRDVNVIVIPGIVQRWNIFRFLIKLLNSKGYPVFTVKGLKRNMMAVEQAALLVRKSMEENRLNSVILIGHSRGGLIAKYVLDFLNTDNKVIKVIALATPFHGTSMAYKIPALAYKEMRPGSELIQKLDEQVKSNSKISSIYAYWDNAVIPTESSVLDGAKNIKIDTWGHQRMLVNKDLEDAVINEVQNI